MGFAYEPRVYVWRSFFLFDILILAININNFLDKTSVKKNNRLFFVVLRALFFALFFAAIYYQKLSLGGEFVLGAFCSLVFFVICCCFWAQKSKNVLNQK